MTKETSLAYLTLHKLGGFESTHLASRPKGFFDSATFLQSDEETALEAENALEHSCLERANNHQPIAIDNDLSTVWSYHSHPDGKGAVFWAEQTQARNTIFALSLYSHFNVAQISNTHHLDTDDTPTPVLSLWGTHDGKRETITEIGVSEGIDNKTLMTGFKPSEEAHFPRAVLLLDNLAQQIPTEQGIDAERSFQDLEAIPNSTIECKMLRLLGHLPR